MYSEYGSKMLAPYLAQWGHTFVLYDGKQQSQDTFKNDPSIKIFLSSDKGSDSINLQEATTVINYDLPWNYSTLEQRVNRINRITSDAAHVFYYNFIMENTIEERKLKLLQRKKEYQQAVFDGDIGDQAEIIAGSTLDDLKWLLS
jgi:SNF2 family DNA or RNA helicase